jgi:hypothetical protein
VRVRVNRTMQDVLSSMQQMKLQGSAEAPEASRPPLGGLFPLSEVPSQSALPPQHGSAALYNKRSPLGRSVVTALEDELDQVWKRAPQSTSCRLARGAFGHALCVQPD